MALSLDNLNNCFKYAREEEAKYVAVVIEGVGQAVEVIINPAENFDQKQEYYNIAYNEDLTMTKVPSIRIVGFTHADSYDEIQALLGL